ncbi:hypothetical protein BN1088_1432175 [Sphingobacterium sp. PM2-P1-29]|nr:hypothetical protein BN1088_1432175 [Sphingobacterium sp. PM2-P1-29]
MKRYKRNFTVGECLKTEDRWFLIKNTFYTGTKCIRSKKRMGDISVIFEIEYTTKTRFYKIDIPQIATRFKDYISLMKFFGFNNLGKQ